MSLVAQLEGKESSGPQAFKCFSPDLMYTLLLPTHQLELLAELPPGTEGQARQSYKDAGSEEVEILPYLLWLTPGQMKMSKRGSQPPRHSQSNRRSLWPHHSIPCRAGFGGSRWKTNHCRCEWCHHVIQQNFSLEHCVSCNNGEPIAQWRRQINHTFSWEAKGSLLWKYWMKTVGHVVILFDESYK